MAIGIITEVNLAPEGRPTLKQIIIFYNSNTVQITIMGNNISANFSSCQPSTELNPRPFFQTHFQYSQEQELSPQCNLDISRELIEVPVVSDFIDPDLDGERVVLSSTRKMSGIWSQLDEEFTNHRNKLEPSKYCFVHGSPATGNTNIVIARIDIITILFFQ